MLGREGKVLEEEWGHPEITQEGRWAWVRPLSWVILLPLSFSFSFKRWRLIAHGSFGVSSSYSLVVLGHWNSDIQGKIEPHFWERQDRQGYGPGEDVSLRAALLGSCWLLSQGTAGLPDFLIFQKGLEIWIVLVCAIVWFLNVGDKFTFFKKILQRPNKNICRLNLASGHQLGISVLTLSSFLFFSLLPANNYLIPAKWEAMFCDCVWSNE